MSSVINGDASTVTSDVVRTITAASNTSPIVVTTSVSHGYSTGDTVVVSGVTGNTAANGSWAIIVTSNTQFSLTTSVGNGAYVSGGSALNVALSPPFTIPSDGDGPIEAADVNVAFEALADRVQYLALRGPLRVDTFNATGTWKAPAGVTAVLVEGYGGGGGGGGGRTADVATSEHANGGSGGGGSVKSTVQVAVTPGTVYTVTIGAAAAGGAANSNGTDGVAATFSSLATFPGGGKGFGSSASPTTFARSIVGGNTVAYTAVGDEDFDVPGYPKFHRHPGCGGGTVGHANGIAGFPSLQGFSGGAAGVVGADDGTTWGGGGGGGGGAGPFGAGGAGQAGGAGVAVGAGVTGSAGIAAGANTGGGGGGGGGGGAGSTSGGAGGAGGAGGTGKIKVIYLGPQAVVT